MFKKIAAFIAAAVIGSCSVLSAFAAPAATEEAAASGSLNSGFDAGLATPLIIIFCSIAALIILTVAVILARRNFHN